ncbi:MAG: VirB3 family type IV secretion system protein [Treponema sp.]|jgi:type IV secretory pathway VirB3-like protein|nr:VirB3 family type IV secretion system protein [Treponema sp.]
MNLLDFTLPIHKSLQQPDLLMGVPKSIFALILIGTIGIIYLFGPLFALIGIAAYIPCRILSKDDPDMLAIALDSLTQPDGLEG